MSRVALYVLLVLFGVRPALAIEPLTDAGIDRRPDAEIPIDRILRDPSGIRVTLRQAASGKPILLLPVQFHCPNICSITLDGLLRAVLQLRYKSGADFVVVAMSIDPGETPQDAKGLLERAAVEFPGVRVQAVTGASSDIAAITDALGYRYAWDPDLRQFDHVAAVAVLTPDGRLSNWLYGVAPQPRDLDLALTAAGAGRVGRWTEQLLLLCYHYDPVTGRYTPIIWTSLKIVAAVVLMVIVLFLAGTLLRERRSIGRS